MEQEWSAEKIKEWAATQPIKRDYSEIMRRIKGLSGQFDVAQYGQLSHNPERYPLFYLKSKDWDDQKPNIIIAGGVHGYEPSGISGALTFLEERAQSWKDQFNFIAYPCVSPWGYEVDHRWDIHAEDPNRGFRHDNPRKAPEECTLFMESVKSLGHSFVFGIDLHETPDRDKELRRLRADRFGTPLVDNPDHIPDGFYLVLDQERFEKEGQQPPSFALSIVESVSKVTQIAPDEEVLNLKNHGGIIYFGAQGLLANYLMDEGFAQVAATTEVYPNPLPPGEAEHGQVAAIEGALRHFTHS